MNEIYRVFQLLQATACEASRAASAKFHHNVLFKQNDGLPKTTAFVSWTKPNKKDLNDLQWFLCGFIECACSNRRGD